LATTEPMLQVRSFMDLVDEPIYKDFSDKIPSNQIFHISMIGVHPSYQRRGIGKKLLLSSLERAKERKFEIAVSENTSEASYQLALKCGFQVRNSVEYKNFVYQ